MEISQIYRRCCHRIYLVAAATASALLPLHPTQMDFRLTWVCVEVKFFGLFMEFSDLLMEFSSEERGKRRKRKKIHQERERERIVFRKEKRESGIDQGGC